jgi:chromosome segregation ATPase
MTDDTTTTTDRLAAVEAELAALKQPKDYLPPVPAGRAHSEAIHARMLRDAEARRLADLGERAERRRQAEADLDRLRPWRRRLNASKANTEALRAELDGAQQRLDEAVQAMSIVQHEISLSPEAAQLLDELEAAGRL